MPKRFSFDFDNGLHVTIKAKNAGERGFAGTLTDAWRWYVDLPLRNLFGSREGKAISELELTFDEEKDAQVHLLAFLRRDQGHNSLEPLENKGLYRTSEKLVINT